MKLMLGEQVVNQYGIRGVVVPATYGTHPFQIKTEYGNYFSYINESGTSPISTMIWKTMGTESITFSEHDYSTEVLTEKEEPVILSDEIRSALNKLTKKGKRNVG